MRECHEFETWIDDQMVTASGEDYGQDYEHLQVKVNSNIQNYENRNTFLSP
jgi:hypothetical protein